MPLLITTPDWLGVRTLDLKLTTQEVRAAGYCLGYNVKGKCPSVMALHSLHPLLYFQMYWPIAKASSPYIKNCTMGILTSMEGIMFSMVFIVQFAHLKSCFYVLENQQSGFGVLVVPSNKGS